MARFLFAVLCATLAIVCQIQEVKPLRPNDRPTLEVERPTTVLERDHQFDSGSGIVISGELTKIQVENLATLGRVWGFLKYNHPSVTSGQHQWDYELFRVLPAILHARDRAAGNAVLLRWIVDLGPVVPCNPCATMDETDLQLRPDLDWIGNAAMLGPDLSQKLKFIRDNRQSGKEFYISRVRPSDGPPSFEHELDYPTLKFPDSGFQLLGLFRFWNIFEYWSPYRNVLGEDWDGVLHEFIPRVAEAKSAESYGRELLAFIAKAHDGHAQLWGALNPKPPAGECTIPVNVRFVENVPVITGFPSSDANTPAELKIGDVITELDGASVSKLFESWKPYYPASNEDMRMRNIARFMTRGECGDAEIAVRRQDREIHYQVKRTPGQNPDSAFPDHALPGPTFRLLSKDVAYLKLSSAKTADAAHYVEEAAGTKGLILDSRNYPSDDIPFALGSFLVGTQTPFARFTVSDLSNPGAFHWTEPVYLSPQKPHYSGKIVILVDDVSISASEFNAMAFRAVRGAIVVGSPTSGADGGVARFDLPGGLHTQITGLGVFYPDKIPTQRIGIVPDIEVRPTIAGVRAGRDEVLEEALRQILGTQVPPANIEKMAKP